MHSSASRAANGMSSAKRAWEDPNRSFMSEARNEPRASAASSGSVIMHRDLNAFCYTIIIDQWSWVNSGCPTAIGSKVAGHKRCRLRLEGHSCPPEAKQAYAEQYRHHRQAQRE